MSLKQSLSGMVAVLLPLSLAAAPPVLAPGSVVNAAGFTPGVTPGAWTTIFGSALAATTATASGPDFVNGGLPTTFRGTSVTINGKPAFLYFVSPNQINLQAPADTASGTVEVVVTTLEGRATVKTVVNRVSPALFSAGPYAAVVRATDGVILGAANAARPGDIVSIYATGLGATNPSIVPGVVFNGSAPAVALPTVTIGGLEAIVYYAGIVSTGLYQINLAVPTGLLPGTYSVVVTHDGVSSPALSLLNVDTDTSTVVDLSLSATGATAAAGANVTFTAIATPPSTTGTVTFYDGPVPLGTAALSAGRASFTTAFAPGQHVVMASFGSGASQVNSLAAAVAVGNVTQCAPNTGTAQVVCLASAFLSTLTVEQRNAIQYTYTRSNATRWSSLPVGQAPRNGVRLGDLTAAQYAAAMALLRAAMSTDGLERLGMIRGADEMIANRNAAARWGAANYSLAFYGGPSISSPWLMQVSGHHYTFNHVFNARQASGTPMFLGTEPVSYKLNGNIYAPLEKQRAALYPLSQALVSNNAARLSGTFEDVTMGGTATSDASFPLTYPSGAAGRGVAVASLPEDQQAMVKRAIESFATDLDAATATELLNAYESAAALDNTWVGFSGSGSLTTPGDYLRIDGPRVWMEFVVQPGVAIPEAYRYRSIWRDKSADYGGDFN